MDTNLILGFVIGIVVLGSIYILWNFAWHLILQPRTSTKPKGYWKWKYAVMPKNYLDGETGIEAAMKTFKSKHSAFKFAKYHANKIRAPVSVILYNENEQPGTGRNPIGGWHKIWTIKPLKYYYWWNRW